jgi:hypothetical protein
MRLEEFWATTPGEVMVVIYAAGEARLDRLELGIHQVWLGRVVSHQKKPDPAAFLPKRRGRRNRRERTVDENRTHAETARWRRKLRAPAAQGSPAA